MSVDEPNNSTNYNAPEDSFQQPEQSSPSVASAPAKNFVFLILFVGAVVLLVWLFFGSKSGDGEEQTIKKPTVTGGRVPSVVIPPPPQIDIPTPEIAPPPITAPPVVENTKPSIFDAEKNPEGVKRLKSDMLITKSGILGGTDLGSGDRFEEKPTTLTAANDNDPNIGFADSFYNQKDTPFASARNLGDTSRLITQGKIIESILETPINTDVPGMIRAIVSRDIYAESGKKILIPKGSRLVGTYNNFVIRGNKRVNVIWSRVIRPDGIDVMIRSPGVDQLGRAGVEGDVDSKYSEIFASAFLVSAINIAVGVGADKINKDSDIQETTNPDGSSTRNTNATNEAALEAIDLFGNAGKNLVNGFLNLKPTISIDQGTRVNVFVNRDLVFPSSMSGEVRVIQ